MANHPSTHPNQTPQVLVTPSPSHWHSHSDKSKRAVPLRSAGSHMLGPLAQVAHSDTMGDFSRIPFLGSQECMWPHRSGNLQGVIQLQHWMSL